MENNQKDGLIVHDARSLTKEEYEKMMEIWDFSFPSSTKKKYLIWQTKINEKDIEDFFWEAIEASLEKDK